MTEKLIIVPKTEDEDGALTPYGMDVAETYARRWVDKAERDLAIERDHPELTGLFYDIRSDADLAVRHATPASQTDAAPAELVSKGFTINVTPPVPAAPFQGLNTETGWLKALMQKQIDDVVKAHGVSMFGPLENPKGSGE